MMSIETIIALNEEIAAEASARKRVPYVPLSAGDVETWRTIPFPNIGYHMPDGWEPTDQTWFVDKTGQGCEWEPALTVPSFLRALEDYIEDHPGEGFAITEEGPFQLYISAFRQVAA